MDSTQVFIQQEIRRVERACATARATINVARTIPDVVRAMTVPVPAGLHGIQRTIPGIRALTGYAERRIQVLVDAQVHAIQGCSSLKEAQALCVRYTRFEWQCLRGRFPRILVETERRIAEIIHKKHTEVSS